MPPEKKTLPLHVSLHRIQEEKKNLARRTKVRLAALLAEQNQEEDNETQYWQYPSHGVQNVRQIQDWRCCLNIFCFGLSLLILNLLFLQWLYI
jgi:hypothetical protein